MGTYIPHLVDLPPIDINLLWHTKYHQDPSNRWLRELVVNTRQELLLRS